MKKMTNQHVPVLLSETIRLLQIKKSAWYIDATAGDGGHTQAILQQGGKVLTIDCDQAAIWRLHQRFESGIRVGDVKIKLGNFAHLDKFVQEEKINQIWGILFDLGMSSYQIRGSGRGFSFLQDEPLDMRMSVSQKQTAADIINYFDSRRLYEIFTKLAEEKLASHLVDAILRARAIKPINTTKQLRDLVRSVYARQHKISKIEPATKTFQGLRIAVNDELANLRKVLPIAYEILTKGGRCAVISFHSLEDRIVKLYFAQLANKKLAEIITKHPIRPDQLEITINPSARSAKLRIAEKI